MTLPIIAPFAHSVLAHLFYFSRQLQKVKRPLWKLNFYKLFVILQAMKSYHQFCALAYALDVIGERWTLLIIRELLTGPRRFKDLLSGLPDISTNLLTERLKCLETQGIVARRTLPPPAGSTVYALTPLGLALESAVLELGKWGSQFLPPSMEGVALPSIGAVSLAIKAFFHPEHAVSDVFELHLDGEILQVRANDGTLEVRQGQALKADAVFHTTVQVFMGMFSGQLPPDAAGLIRIEGDPAALTRFLRQSSVPAGEI
jgi:DNA-binding HxlR family transcriptional regulator